MWSDYQGAIAGLREARDEIEGESAEKPRMMGLPLEIVVAEKSGTGSPSEKRL